MSLKGIYSAPAKDIAESGLVAAIQLQLNTYSPNPMEKAFAWLIDETSEVLYKIGKTGAATPMISGIPDAFVRSVTVTLVAGVASVAFTAPIAGANYRISLGWNSNENVYWENKAAGGFDLRSSDSSSTATVDVTINRQGPP